MGVGLDPPGFAPGPDGLQPTALLIELRILASGRAGRAALVQPPEESHLDRRIQSALSYS